MNSRIVTLIGLTLVSAAGCSQRISPPAGYVQVRDPAPYDFKAVAPAGNAIAHTRHPNEQADADLSFWSAAVEHQKVAIDGLKLVNRSPVKSQSGRDGTLLEFEVGAGAQHLTYLIGLFVDADYVDVIEAAGPAEKMAADRDKLSTAIASLK